MKPWRQLAVPHRDVLEGTFQQSEFAADLSALRHGRASAEYQDAATFFERTYITEGMGQLLTKVAQRLNGSSGDPIVQLQTPFGGGKTHTMMATYHLAKQVGATKDLRGIPRLLDRAGVMGIPPVHVAVLDGTALAPGQPWCYGGQSVQTLWGELAWQLGGAAAFEQVRRSDETGTSPGKETMRALILEYGPCLILVDELVAYIRQFTDSEKLSGGSFESNLTFVQVLTEAVKSVPNAMLLASLPASKEEAGGQHGESALRSLEKTFGRVHALWRPVATEESFEIVRRRLFEPIRDDKERQAVLRGFAQLYQDEGRCMPALTQEARYLERLGQAYPIHPEVFDRLYEDWATLPNFQRTRGVLKLMAHVIHRLWKDNNQDYMIMPGSLTLSDPAIRNELIYHLNPGWQSVIERDIDGERSEPAKLDMSETRFGDVAASRSVTRTLFLGSAPSAGQSEPGNRGLTRAQVMLGCMQPGGSAAIYRDALKRLADQLHYLTTNDHKDRANTRYWFDTRANLRREMEERKRRIGNRRELEEKLQKFLQVMLKGCKQLSARHVFTPHADVPDDALIRLVVLKRTESYSKHNEKSVQDAVKTYVENHGSKPRYRGNRLLFLVADTQVVGRMEDAARTALAWASILEDVASGRLNIDGLQEKLAQKEFQISEGVVERTIRDCYRWLLSPVLLKHTDREMEIDPIALSTSDPLSEELDRISTQNELVIPVWAAVHLGTVLQQIYWKEDRPAVKAMTVWEDSLKYLYLPRLQSQKVFERAILASSEEYFGLATGESEAGFEGFGRDHSTYRLDESLLLIEPGVAAAYTARKEAERARQRESTENQLDEPGRENESSELGGWQEASRAARPVQSVRQDQQEEAGATVPRKSRFYGEVKLAATTAKTRFVDIFDEVITLLNSDPNAEVEISINIDATFPEGVAEHLKRSVSENANTLQFDQKHWE